MAQLTVPITIQTDEILKTALNEIDLDDLCDGKSDDFKSGANKMRAAVLTVIEGIENGKLHRYLDR